MVDRFFKTYEETQVWLDEMGVEGCTINDDLTVDVFGNVYLSERGLTHIPVQFGVVAGDFLCGSNHLTNLIGAPMKCRSLDFDNNKLTSLTGATAECISFGCQGNRLTNLIGAPRQCKILWCSYNDLTSLEGAPEKCEKISCAFGNLGLYDISAAPDGCEIKYDQDLVSKNQAARQLTMLEKSDGDVLRLKSGRLL